MTRTATVHRMKTEENGFIRGALISLFGVLGLHPLCADEVALGLENAAALDDDGVAEDPLQPPVGDALVLRSVPHGLQEGFCRH